jgi:hypothetical protein
VAAWIGTTRLFRLFVDNFDQYQNVYGTLASVVVYLWYLYMSGIVLLVGAELNGELAKRRAVRDAMRTRGEAPPPLPAAPVTAETAAIEQPASATAPIPQQPTIEMKTAGDDSETQTTSALPRSSG